MVKRPHGESAFTLVELLVTISLVAILLTLAASALRQFWFVRSLEGGADQVVTQLRTMQQSAVAESNPIVYGAAFVEDTETWQPLRYLPPTTAGGSGTCDPAGGLKYLDAGVVFSEVDFSGEPAGLDATDAVDACAEDAPGADDDGFVFFLARGTARPGTVTLYQPNLDRSEIVEVVGLTSRVAKQ